MRSVIPRGRFGQDARSAWEPGFLVEGAATLRRVAEPVNLSFRSASLFSRVGVLVVRGAFWRGEAPLELGGPPFASAFQRLRPCGRRESAHSSQRDPHVNVKSHTPSTVVRRALVAFVWRLDFPAPDARGVSRDGDRTRRGRPAIDVAEHEARRREVNSSSRRSAPSTRRLQRDAARTPTAGNMSPDDARSTTPAEEKFGAVRLPPVGAAGGRARANR